MVTLEQRAELLHRLEKGAGGLDRMVVLGSSGQEGLHEVLRGRSIEDEEVYLRLIAGKEFMSRALEDFKDVLGASVQPRAFSYPPELIARHFGRVTGKGQRVLGSIVGQIRIVQASFDRLLHSSYVSPDDAASTSNSTGTLLHAYQTELQLVPKRESAIRFSSDPQRALTAHFR